MWVTQRRHAGIAGVAALAALVASVAMARAGGAPVSTADRTAIRRVIGEQLEAFKRHDAKAAFSHAAPAIQELFGNPETFMVMVQREYPAIYRPRSFTFGELEVVAGELTQQVTVVGENGDAAAAFYLMARQGDGTWRVLGCILVPIERNTI